MSDSLDQLAEITKVADSLATVSDIREIKNITQKARALRTIFSGVLENEVLATKAHEVELQSQRRGGQLIIELKQKGELTHAHSPRKETQALTLQELGISKDDSSFWQRLASIPETEWSSLLGRVEAIRREGNRLIAREVRRATSQPDNSPILFHQEWGQGFPGDFADAPIEKESVDLILTDPPYPKEYFALWASLARKASEILKPGGWLVTYSGHLSVEPAIIELTKYLRYHWMIGLKLVQENNIPQFSIFSHWKPILVFYKEPRNRAVGFSDFIQGGGAEKSEGFNPNEEGFNWQQRLDEAEKLLEIFSKPGDTVFEPCAGFGTVVRACANKHRNVYWSEINPKRFDAIERRIDRR